MLKLITKTKQTTAVILSLILTVSAVLGQLPASTRAAAAGYGISNPVTDSNGVTTWDCIWFGNYWQSNETTKEPIKWRVLSVNGDDAFLLADQNLDCQPYNTEYIDVTWETCSLRTWLNTTFYQNAFSSAEQAAIWTTTVVNEDNPYYGTEGGNNTQDKVYLLSIAEASNVAYGFSSEYREESETRESKNTEYAKVQGAWTSTISIYAGNGWWWLRSPGGSSCNAADVWSDGWGGINGNSVYSVIFAVRPALHINLSSSTWSKAGTVSSSGGSAGGATASPTGSIPTAKPSATPVESTKESLYKKSITDALPALGNLGSAELKGPEITIGKNKFNLFKTKMNISLPLFGKNYPLKIKVDESANTAEVLLGFEPNDIKSDPNDPYWRKTYQQVKSLVQRFGGKVDTTKLWNQFSKLRGRLKKINGDAVFSVGGNVAGYLKLQLDESGNIQNVIEGGITFGLSASGKVKTPLWWIVYSEFAVSGSIDGKIFLTAKNAKAISLNGEFGLAIKPSVALGADAVVVDVKGGLEGKLEGKLKLPWAGFRESVSVDLTGKVFVKVNTLIPGLSGGRDWNFPKLELYPDFGKVTKESVKLEYSRSQKVTKQALRKMNPLSTDAISSIADSVVYENAKPQMTELPDGRILMTYLDDTVSGAGGQATLMYRIYENGSWGEVSPVRFTGHLDTAAKVKVHNNKIWLLYENSDTAITEDMTATEIASHMKLCVVEFQEAADRFSAPAIVGENSTGFKYGFDFATDGNDLYCVWAENSADDILLANGSTRICQSLYQNGEWKESEVLAEDSDALPEFTVGWQNGSQQIAYVKDRKLYIDGEEVVVTGEVADSVRFSEGGFYFRVDGQLCRYDGEESEMTGIQCSADYRIAGSDVYWTEQDNFKSELYRQTLSGTAGAVAITDDGGYIGSFCVLSRTGNEPVLAYTLQQVNDISDEDGSPYGLTLLKFKDDMSRVQGEVTNVAYDILSFTPGETNDVVVTVSNTGTENLNQIVITVCDKEGNVLCEKETGICLEPGTDQECTLSVPIPEDFQKENITVTMRAAESFEKEASTKAELEISATDIEVSQKSEDSILVTNKAEQSASHVTVKVTDGNEGGTLLQQTDIGTLASGEKKEISVASLWDKATINTQTQKKYLSVEISQEEMEYELWNNTLQLEKKVKKTDTSIDATPTPSPTPTQKPSPTKTPVPTKKPDITIQIPIPTQKPDSVNNNQDVVQKPEPTVAPVSENTELKDSTGTAYTITKSGLSEGEAAYAAPKNKKVTSITIPATVELSGITYKVTSIKANAFKNCKKLKKVTIGKNIKNIGKKAFYGCVKLKNITIKTKKLTNKSVGSKAFAKIHKKAKFKVPKKKLSAYKKLLKKKGV